MGRKPIFEKPMTGAERQRSALLREANLGLDKLRFFFRMATDLRFLDARRYEHAARGLDDVGRLVGGWLRTHDAAQA
jgi:hypothetical protein